MRNLNNPTGQRVSHKDIADLRMNGCNILEICLITGKDRKTVSTVCRKVCNIPATDEELLEARMIATQKNTHSEEWVKSYILDKSFGAFEYVGRYVNMDSHCLMRCVKCGQVEERSMISLRSGKRVRCLLCQKKETEQRQKEQEKKRIENEQVRLTAKLIRAGSGKQLTFGFCACGEMLNRFDGRKGKQCRICAKKAENKRSEIMRRHKISKALVDSDITLPKLYQKDNGICYLCGGSCDWNDKEVRENAIVCGNQYPSIDHVIPLAKGGLHSWDNVRLAHRICNSLKSDDYDKSTMEKTNN